jgi:hypothetical protein
MKSNVPLKRSILWIFLVLTFAMTSCVTYHISTQSLLEQLASISRGCNRKLIERNKGS